MDPAASDPTPPPNIHYLEYSSTTRLSLMSCPNSERSGAPLNVPVIFFASTSTHDGKPTFSASCSASWMRSCDFALSVVGGRATSVTLAAVVDFEAASTVRGRETQRLAQDRLDEAARSFASRIEVPVGTVILFGEPGEALQHYAAENSYELIVAGSHSARRNHLAARATNGSPAVPVLIGPGVA